MKERVQFMCLILLTASLSVGSFGFVNAQTTSKSSSNVGLVRYLQPGMDFPDYPPLVMTAKSQKLTLPAVVDNSLHPYLRKPFLQQGNACGQSSTVAYNFCYEINRLRQQPSDTITRTYPDHFAYNFMNATEPYYGEGVSYFHTFDILYDAGCPTEADYGSVELDDNYFWMSGYDKYYNAMHNRISGVKSIAVNTPEGLKILKHWLYDHLEGSPVGGVASFTAGGIAYYQLPAGTPEAGKTVQIKFGPNASHALTIIGYNDSIRYDRNNDGQYTNHLDINGDGVVDMKDWEIGGLKYMDSSGEYNPMGYMLYSTLAEKYGEGGIWNNAVHVLIPEPDYRPQLTIKTRIKHNTRGKIKLIAGVSTDTSSRFPEYTLAFSIFNFQGGDFYMQGGQYEADKSLEAGLDITPLLGHMKPGEPARFFLMVQEDDSTNLGFGHIESFSVIRYTETASMEYTSSLAPCGIADNGLTVVSVATDFLFLSPEIQPEYLSLPQPDSLLEMQLSASGGTPPYSWDLAYEYTEIQQSGNFVPLQGDTLIIGTPYANFVRTPLPFSFPFMGKTYDTLSMHRNGYLMFNTHTMPFTYLLFDDSYLKQLRCIAPYMNYELDLNHAGDRLLYSADSSHATFMWTLSAKDEEGSVTYITTLFPDGRIVHHYGPNSLKSKYEPVIGLGSGMAASTVFGRTSGKRPQSGMIIEFQPESQVPGLSIDNNGLLTSASPFPDSTAGSITVQLTDAQRIGTARKYNLSSIPVVELYPQTLLTPGASSGISATFGSQEKEALVNLKLTSLSPLISVTDSILENVIIAPGETLIVEDAFRINVSSSITKATFADLKLEIVSGSGSKITYVAFQIAVPEIAIVPVRIEDGGNGIAEPGETFEMVFRIFNHSKAPASEITATASVNDPMIALNGQSVKSLGNLGGATALDVSFPFVINPACGPGFLIFIQLDLRDTEQNLVHSELFPLIIGEPKILVIDLDKNANSAQHIQASITQLGISSSPMKVIDSTIFNYDFVFLSLGVIPYHHIVKAAESNLLVSFLTKGGSLYLESGAFFKQDPYVPLRDYFGVVGYSQAFTKPPDTLAGEAGTPVQGINIHYRGDKAKIENLVPSGSARVWFTDKNSGFHFVAVNDSINYRTIASTFEFGGTFPFDGSDRKDIMNNYLSFLGFPINVLAANFHADQESICPHNEVNFEPFCSGTPSSYHWTFEGGTPGTWEGEHPNIRYFSPGTYGVELTIEDASGHQNTLKRENIIVVENCLSIPEHAVNGLHIYPNPAAEQFIIDFGSPTTDEGWVTVSSVHGQNLKRLKVNPGTESVSVAAENLKPGIYIVSFQAKNSRAWGKVVVL